MMCPHDRGASLARSLETSSTTEELLVFCRFSAWPELLTGKIAVSSDPREVSIHISLVVPDFTFTLFVPRPTVPELAKRIRELSRSLANPLSEAFPNLLR